MMLDDLILLRLLAAPDLARGETRSAVRDDLRPLVSHPEQGETRWREAFDEAVNRLAQADDLSLGKPKGARLALTDSGQERARRVFDVPADGSDTAESGKKKSRSRNRPAGWSWWRDHYALPKALRSKRAATAAELRVALLHRLFLSELPDSISPDTLAAAVDLLLAKRLAVSPISLTAFRAAAVRAWVIGETLPAAKPEAPAAPVPSSGHSPVTAQPSLPNDVMAFAKLVHEAAQHCGTGRFDQRKVFVSHVWRTLIAAGHTQPNEESIFKQQLIRANTAGLLRLSRADLAGAHDVGDVHASEIRYLGELFILCGWIDLPFSKLFL